MEQTIANEGAVSKRPSFLTVLCILTWIGVAVSIIMGMVAYSTARRAAEMMGSLDGLSSEGLTGAAAAATDALSSSLKNIRIQLAGSVIGALICLIGSILMWKLKKSGYYTYVAGQAFAIAIPFIFPILGVSGGMGVLGMIVPVIFIVLYGMNLKHMR